MQEKDDNDQSTDGIEDKNFYLEKEAMVSEAAF
jgi:hypothetical protein